MALFVDALEPAAIEKDIVRVFARQHGIGLRAGGHQDGVRGHPHGLSLDSQTARLGIVVVTHDVQSGCGTRSIHLYFVRSNTLGKENSLFQSLRDFFMVQRVTRRIDHAFAVSDADASPRLE